MFVQHGMGHMAVSEHEVYLKIKNIIESSWYVYNCIYIYTANSKHHHSIILWSQKCCFMPNRTMIYIYIYGDGSKPWYLVNPKIAGIYGCSSHYKCIYRYWPIPIYIYIMVLLGMKQHFWDHRMIEWWCLELAVYIYIYTPYYGKWWWTNWFPFYPTVQTTPRRSQKRPRRIGRWFGSRGSYIDGPGFQWRNLGQEKTTMMGKPGKTWETTCFICFAKF